VWVRLRSCHSLPQRLKLNQEEHHWCYRTCCSAASLCCIAIISARTFYLSPRSPACLTHPAIPPSVLLFLPIRLSLVPPVDHFCHSRRLLHLGLSLFLSQHPRIPPSSSLSFILWVFVLQCGNPFPRRRRSFKSTTQLNTTSQHHTTTTPHHNTTPQHNSGGGSYDFHS
jgi:hypothetical protein